MEKFLKGALLLAVAVTCATTQAVQSSNIRAAEGAIRNVIKVRLGDGLRVVFHKGRENIISANESRVTGSGFLSSRDGWQGNEFEYSVKVRRRTQETRDASMTLDTGQTYVISDDWSKPDLDRPGDLEITTPDWNQSFDTGRVTISGKANGGDVVVNVFDRNNRKVVDQKVKPNNRGDWTVVTSLSAGSYRATATDTWKGGGFDEVRFSVRGNVTPPKPNDQVKITFPLDSREVNGPRVDARGTTSNRDVSIKLYDSKNKLVSNQNIASSRGDWSAGLINLAPGKYRLVVTSGRDTDEVRFTVKGKQQPRGKG